MNPVFLLYADFDNLKEINDVLGHQEEDQALMDTARVLKETFRGSDIVARMGGDEFVVITMAAKRQDADIVAMRFRKQVAAHNEKNDRPYRLSISVGMFCFEPEHPRSTDELLNEAEKRMYEGKMQKQREA